MEMIKVKVFYLISVSFAGKFPSEGNLILSPLIIRKNDIFFFVLSLFY